jgi:hypothetical protein
MRILNTRPIGLGAMLNIAQRYSRHRHADTEAYAKHREGV